MGAGGDRHPAIGSRFSPALAATGAGRPNADRSFAGGFTTHDVRLGFNLIRYFKL